jgi:hypothetical protein
VWRHLLTLGSAISLLICAAACVFWVRSYAGPDYLHYVSRDQWALSVISGHGTVDVLVIPTWRQDPEFRRGRYDAQVYYGTRYSKRVLGFGTDVQWPEFGGRYVNVPHWFLATAAAAAALVFGRASWRRGRRRRRLAAGLCAACGYDLRATPARCPECGTSDGVTP